MISWDKCLNLPEGLLTESQVATLAFVENRSSITYPCPIYCTLGKKLYLAKEVISDKNPDTLEFKMGCEDVSLSMVVAGKYGVTTTPSDEVILASPQFPYRYYNFDGCQPNHKPRSEIAYLVKRFVIYLPDTPDFTLQIESLPVRAFHSNRLAEAENLIRLLLPSLSTLNNALVFDIVKATTTKRALLSEINYEKLEFLGDAVIELILTLTSSTWESRKSNRFLNEKARGILTPYMLDFAPTTQKMTTLLNRGVEHLEATKIFADCLEAIAGAFYLHLGIFPTISALEKFQICETEPNLSLYKEIGQAAFKLAMTIKVFRNSEIGESVGELHLRREGLIAGLRSSVIFPDFDNFQQLFSHIESLSS